MSNTTLKIAALILMTIDHVGSFIPGMPIALRWIGRLSAPVFLFCVLEGIEKTSNRKKYLLRLYLCSNGMAVLDVIITKLLYKDRVVDDNIFLVYFGIAAFISIIDWSKEKYHSMKKGIGLITIWQIGTIMLAAILSIISLPVEISIQTVIIIKALMGNILSWQTNTIFVMLGVTLYYLKSDKKKFAIVYCGFSLLPAAFYQIDFFPLFVGRLQYILKYTFTLPEIPVEIFCGILQNILYMLGIEATFCLDLPVSALWESNYQWMMIGALPLLMHYNGKRGKGYKYFFYWYYPAHILALALIQYNMF